MIQIEYSNDKLEIKGHSGYAPIGQDIICSAVTILWRTLVEELKPEDYKEASGHSVLNYEGLIRQRPFQTVLTGFKLLDRECGQYVSVKKV